MDENTIRCYAGSIPRPDMVMGAAVVSEYGTIVRMHILIHSD